MKQKQVGVGMERKKSLPQVQIPVSTVVSFLCRDALEALHQFVIEMFDFAICLGVARGRAVVVDVVPLDECLEFLQCELFSSVSIDLSGFPISPDDVFQELDCSSCRTFLEGPGEGSGGRIVDGSDDVPVAMVCLDEFSHKIEFPEFKSLLDAIGVDCPCRCRIPRALLELTGDTRIQHLPAFLP